MYEDYTRQAFPSREYRELLGSALFAFNANNAFIIENILDADPCYNWFSLVDKESGPLIETVGNTISKKCGDDTIKILFGNIVGKRNRIIHSFAITDTRGEQILATKTKGVQESLQFIITEEYLFEFLRLNEELALLLHKYRGY